MQLRWEAMTTRMLVVGEEAACEAGALRTAPEEEKKGTREAGLVREAVFDHEAEEVDGVAAVAAGAPALVGAAVEEALAAQHHVGALTLLPDLQPVLHLGLHTSCLPPHTCRCYS